MRKPRKEDFVSAKEVAAHIGVSVDSVRRAYWKGEIPGYRFCRMVRFDLDQVRRLMRKKGLGGAVRAKGARVAGKRGMERERILNLAD